MAILKWNTAHAIVLKQEEKKNEDLHIRSPSAIWQLNWLYKFDLINVGLNKLRKY